MLSVGHAPSPLHGVYIPKLCNVFSFGVHAPPHTDGVDFTWRSRLLHAVFLSHRRKVSLLGAKTFNIAQSNLTRSSAIAERPARRFVSVEMLADCYTQIARQLRSNCHVLFGNDCTASMRCSVSYTYNAEVSSRGCNQQTLIQPTLLMSTVIIKVRLPPNLTPSIPPPAHRRGRGPLRRMDTHFRR